MLTRYLVIFFGLFILLGCQKSQTSAFEEEEISNSTENPTVKELTFKDLQGNDVQLKEYKGKKVILHYWATWCKPCIEELPALASALPKLEDQNYVLLLVSEHTVEEITDFQKKKGFDFEYLRYEGALSELNIYALPATLIYNEKGEKIEEISGRMDWDSEPLFNQLTSLPK